MGFNLGMSSDSKTTANYSAAGAGAVQNTGKDGQSGQTNIGRNSTVQTGLLDLNKVSVAKGGTLSVNIGDTQAVEDLSKQFALTVQDISGQNSDSLSAAVQGMGDQLKSAFTQLAALGESKQTEGDSGRNKIILYVVLGVLALVGLIFFLRR